MCSHLSRDTWHVVCSTLWMNVKNVLKMINCQYVFLFECTREKPTLFLLSRRNSAKDEITFTCSKEVNIHFKSSDRTTLHLLSQSPKISLHLVKGVCQLFSIKVKAAQTTSTSCLWTEWNCLLMYCSIKVPRDKQSSTLPSAHQPISVWFPDTQEHKFACWCLAK